MKKVGLVTLNGNDNYGNKLQHFAIQKIIESYDNYCVQTIRFLDYTKFEYDFKHIYKLITRKRYRNFVKFDKNINYYKKIFFYKNKQVVPIEIENKFDYFLVGSDQVWNSTISSFRTFYLLDFVKDIKKKNSISASLGTNYIVQERIECFKNSLKNFNMISVREDKGKELIEEVTNRTDIEVLIDPSMLLTVDEWSKFIKKPNILGNSKYILNYFLGNVSDSRKLEIERIAKENDCIIINILDKNSPFYSCGPSEFLYLEKNAFLICTDSFHSSVFALLFNKPFVVFDREQKGIENMNSRIDTLISKFKLKNRRYNGKHISKESLKCDYTEAYQVLEKERAKSRKFLEKALDITNK